MKNLLEKHFDVAFNAPNGIQKLRELILTLAMKGKLVPQDPDDQPASELLKEIEAEKQRLVREGKIKKTKPLPEIKPEEIPYKLPKGWEWVRLRDISFDHGQKVPDQFFTYIDVGSIDNNKGKIGENLQLLEACEAPSRARKIVKKGSVIYSTVRPYLLNIAIVEREYKHEPIVSTAFAVLHPYKVVLNRFILYYLKSPVFISYVELMMKGVAYPAINDGNFFRGLFPLPPLPEQRRIVAKIDQLMARCDELERLRAEQEKKRITTHTSALSRLLKAPNRESFDFSWQFIIRHFNDLYSVKENVSELRKAILQLAMKGKLVPQDPDDQPASELLEEIEAEKRRLVREGKIKKSKPLPEIKPEEIPYNLPKGWEWVRLNDFGIWKSGSTPSRSNSLYYGGGIPWVKSGEVKVGKISRTEESITEQALKKCSFDINPVGSVLIAMYGANIGDIGILEIEATTNQAVCACNPFYGIEKRFLFNLLVSLKPSFVFQGAGAAQPNISRVKIIQTIVPLPPLPEQRRIIAKIDHLMACCNELEKQIESSSNTQITLLESVLNFGSALF